MTKTSLPPLLETFLEMLFVERGASKNTLEAYRRDLLKFHTFLTTAGTTLDTAHGDHIRSYLLTLYDEGLSDAVQRAIFLPSVNFIVFYCWKKRTDDPSSKVSMPKQEKNSPLF